MPADTKARIIDASAQLFRRNGYTGTGVKQIAAAAEAPFASLYHFFPGGKEQLAGEAIRQSGHFYLQIWETILDASPDVVTGVRNVFIGAAATLVQTDYADACPIATVALEVASTSEPLRLATADVFESWIVAAAARFERAGMKPKTAREVTITVLCSLEGAFLLCRATKTTAAMEIAGATAVAAVRAGLDGPINR